MNIEQIIWDFPEEADGNYRHIIDGHDVTVEEVEEVLLAPDSSKAFSRSSGYPMVFGWTTTGQYLAVVYEEVLDDPLIVRPITAFPAPPPER